MAKPAKSVTPANRVENWKKLWATPRRLDNEATEEAFDEFMEAFVPSHMHKKFLQFFGLPKSKFGNRFFMEDAVFHNWDMKLSGMGAGDGTHVEVEVIYAVEDQMEGHWLRGESRRSLRDIMVDDWQAACAIVRGGQTTAYVFIEPKMRGCVVRIVGNE